MSYGRRTNVSIGPRMNKRNLTIVGNKLSTTKNKVRNYSHDLFSASRGELRDDKVGNRTEFGMGRMRHAQRTKWKRSEGNARREGGARMYRLT